MKHLLLAVALIGLLARVYFVYLRPQVATSGQPGQTLAQTVNKLRHDARGADAEADTAAWKDAASKTKAPVASAPVPAAAPAANNPARAEIEAALKDLHVTTIMPGQPGMFIIGKQDYSEGENLPLPKGRKARIVSVQDDGVQLACEGMAFHLDAPAAPDLAAMRKKK